TDSSPGSINATPPNSHEGARTAGPPACLAQTRIRRVRGQRPCVTRTTHGATPRRDSSGVPARTFLSERAPSAPAAQLPIHQIPTPMLPTRQVEARLRRAESGGNWCLELGSDERQKSGEAALIAARTHGSGYRPITTTPRAQKRMARSSG